MELYYVDVVIQGVVYCVVTKTFGKENQRRGIRVWIDINKVILLGINEPGKMEGEIVREAFKLYNNPKKEYNLIWDSEALPIQTGDIVRAAIMVPVTRMNWLDRLLGSARSIAKNSFYCGGRVVTYRIDKIENGKVVSSFENFERKLHPEKSKMTLDTEDIFRRDKMGYMGR